MLTPYHPLQLAMGLAIWITWFALMYGVLAIACEVAPPHPEHGAFTWINVALLFSTLAVTVPLLHWANSCRNAARTDFVRSNPTRLFIVRVGAGINLVGAIAAIAMGLMALLLPPCI